MASVSLAASEPTEFRFGSGLGSVASGDGCGCAVDSGAAVTALVEPAHPPLRLRFDPPHEFDGKKYDELVFDFDGLTDKDFQRAERTLLKLYIAQKKTAATPDIHLFNCVLAAQVANVPLGLIQSLPRRYYSALRAQWRPYYLSRHRAKHHHMLR